MMREKDLKENGLADMAYKVERDHEVQMARGDLYKVAKYGIKLHEMLKGVSEEQGLEGWVQAKITKAADYLGSVYHHLDYEMKFDEVSESKKADKFEPHTMYKDGKSKKANTEKDHKDLAKKGWSHDNPKTKKVEESEEATMTVTNADKNTNSKAWQRYKAGDPKYKYDKDAVPDKPKTKTTDSKSYVDYLQAKLDEAKGVCAECGNPSYTTLGLSEAELDEVAGPEKCWKGYKKAGTQKGTGKNAGKRVNKCVKA
jgi:hypothetical protein